MIWMLYTTKRMVEIYKLKLGQLFWKVLSKLRGTLNFDILD